MAYEQQIKRTIWVAKCEKCGDSSERVEGYVRERYCMNCKVWVPYVEQSFTGPELK